MDGILYRVNTILEANFLFAGLPLCFFLIAKELL